MRLSKITALLLLAVSMPALSSSDEVVVAISLEASTAIDENVAAHSVSATVTNLSGSEIKNVILRPDGTAHSGTAGDALQFGALSDGDTRTLQQSLHRFTAGTEENPQITWRLDFDDSSGEHHRRIIATQ